MSRLQRRVTSFQTRLAQAEKCANSPNFKKLMHYVNEATYNFIVCQVRNQQVNPKGRRYTLEEKIIALSLLKASGRGFRLLSKIFALPSRRTLTNLLNRIPFKTGINKRIFENLKKHVQNMNVQERCCIIMFDEIALECSINYDKKDDCVMGLEDNGIHRKAALADHANVVLLKGLYKQWKQPLSFTFSCGPAKSVDLKELIRRIVVECQEIGLDILASVCDQGAANRAAINSFLEDVNCLKNNIENKHFGFLVNDIEVIPLYDIPHLVKGFRNNLLLKYLHFILNGQKKVAKWEHIEQFYQLDVSVTYRICTKLTDKHILKNQINKMKVSCCTQVFSYTVGSLMRRIANWNIEDRNKLKEEAVDTADFILFMDSLFDCLNSSSKVAPKSKPLKGGITDSSVHEEFLKDAIKTLQSMRFFSNEKQQFVSTPSINNMIFTIKGILYLKDILLTEKHFDYVLTRSLNQDPLENFFGAIRSIGFRNTNPDVIHFIDAFKNLVINNFMSHHSPSANCEEDLSTGALDNLRVFLTGEVLEGIAPLEEEFVIADIPEHVSMQKKTKIGRCTLAYMSGYIAKQILKSRPDCDLCKKNLFYIDKEVDYDFIEARVYQNSTLIKPGKYLQIVLNECLQRLCYVLPRVCYITHISLILDKYLQKTVNFLPLNCTNHNNQSLISKIIVKCALYWWTKRVNLILKGKDTRFAKFLATNPPKYLIDPIMVLAHKKYTSKKHYKKK